ncbi:DUF2778 domain-containing protein [Trinickia violacea]|uniref:DUF2778 domain-containing protein n=1 Tax=Trinickia violacea TaxID=2571746 RepID=A0A4P8IP13_9BURK|nr:DUF2778 domain-containing protein [Trinickia violacea]QCP48683.1 DUF2778 domain-containing protein [Trinickia violacea]
MLQCSFELNDKPMSTFKINGAISVPAFSGLAPHINQRLSACLPSLGPIPPGRYYIVDRESGGRLGWLREAFIDRSDWFALYTADGKIDDEMFCNEVLRGNFRLHPKGPRGISQGCIVIDSAANFYRVRGLLVGCGRHPIPGSALRAYGMVAVK